MDEAKYRKRMDVSVSELLSRPGLKRFSFKRVQLPSLPKEESKPSLRPTPPALNWSGFPRFFQRLRSLRNLHENLSGAHQPQVVARPLFDCVSAGFGFEVVHFSVEPGVALLKALVARALLLQVLVQFPYAQPAAAPQP